MTGLQHHRYPPVTRKVASVACALLTAWWRRCQGRVRVPGAARPNTDPPHSSRILDTGLVNILTQSVLLREYTVHCQF